MNRNNITALVPCPACGAWAGEPCKILYRKDGSPPGGEAAPSHHMARCGLWHVIKRHRGEQSANHDGLISCRSGMSSGCSYEINERVLRHVDEDECGPVHLVTLDDIGETRERGAMLASEIATWRGHR